MNRNIRWKCTLVLDQNQNLISGSNEDLANAIKRGADLRIFTDFYHNEHIDTNSLNSELVREVSDFRVTYLLDKSWVAGIMNLRMPVEVPIGFGPRPSMSFFMYNQNGNQAIARPYLDGDIIIGKTGSSPIDDHSRMPKYHQFDSWDAHTNAPSSNFVYDFDRIKYFVRDEWEEVYSNDANGNVVSGSLNNLTNAFEEGCEIKVGITGLCSDLADPAEDALVHEVFTPCGSGYHYTEQGLFMVATQPIVRVKPDIPIKYKSEKWDFGWLMLRSDGFVAYWLVNPYTLKFNRRDAKYAMRWFVC